VVIGELLGEATITARGVAQLEALPTATSADAKPLDVLFGLPGIAGALGAAATMTGHDSLGDAAVDYARAAETSWRAAADGGRRDRIEALRIGVAHGITGVELCAARVYEATGDEQTLTWITDMIELENERVDRRGGVPARLDAVTRQPDRGWCWGVAGYVMARGAVADITGLTQAGHATDAGRRLAADTNAGNDRLCCGRAAQADVLEPDNPNLRSLLDRPIQWSFERGTHHQNASLLRGIAGVGLTLLRAAAPGRVPQPLTLDPVRSGT
jgi:lantibiotic modifying enzyme